MADLALVAARFAGRLREAGLAVGPERAGRFAASVTLGAPPSTKALYWCGLATLIADPAEIPLFDRLFWLVFGAATDDPAEAAGDPAVAPTSGSQTSGPAADATRPRDADVAPAMASAHMGGADARDGGDARERPVPSLAAATERLAGRDFATLSPAELAELLAFMRTLRL